MVAMKTRLLFSLLFAVVATITLSSCAGDRVPPLPTLNDARIESHALVSGIEGAGMKAVKNAPAFHSTSITQSSNSASVSTMFDGTNVELTIEHQPGSKFTLKSSTNSVTETLDRDVSVTEALAPDSPVSGHMLRDWTLFDNSRTGTSSAHVVISWNNSDPTDYLAGGYWMHLSGDLSNESIASADIGAYIDGTEFAGAPILPVLGTATYRGHASGLYTFSYGPSWANIPRPPGVEPGTREAGVYTGIANLTADFETNTISGCIGCIMEGEDPEMVILETAGDIIDPDGNRYDLYAVYHNRERGMPGDGSWSRIKLGDAPIDPSTGTFTGTDITVEIDYFQGSTSSGTWGGKFSNKPEGSGEPRLVGGTTSVEWSHPDGDNAVFIGNFFADKDVAE